MKFSEMSFKVNEKVFLRVKGLRLRVTVIDSKIVYGKEHYEVADEFLKTMWFDRSSLEKVIDKSSNA